MYGFEIVNKVMTSVEEFQEAFQLFDSRGDNKIHVSQIGDALRALGQNPTESDVKKFAHQHKPDERISFEVFLPIYQAISKARSSDTTDDFIEGLRHFDKDGNGFISSAELRHLLTTLGEKLTDEEVEQLLAGQEDSQGNVNYEEFVNMIMSGLRSEESYINKIFVRKEDVIEKNNQVAADKVEILFQCKSKDFEISQDEGSEAGSCIFYDVSEPNIIKDTDDGSGFEEYYDVIEDSDDINESIVHHHHVDNEVGSNTNENNARSINNEATDVDENNSVNEVIISEAAKLASNGAEDCGKNISEGNNIDKE